LIKRVCEDEKRPRGTGFEKTIEGIDEMVDILGDGVQIYISGLVAELCRIKNVIESLAR
jgi:hypothetical protein